MNLEKAKELFLLENKILEEEEKQISSIYQNIEGLLPYALKKIRNIEDFEITFRLSPETDEIKKDRSFKHWSNFLLIKRSKCFIEGMGKYDFIITHKEYRRKIEIHFQELGWNCRVIPKSFLYYTKIIISYPKVSFWKKIYFRLLNLFAKEKIQALPTHPYR